MGPSITSGTFLARTAGDLVHSEGLWPRHGSRKQERMAGELGSRHQGMPSDPQDAWYADGWNITLVILFSLLLVLLLLWVFGFTIV